MDNQFSFARYWSQSDPISHAVALVLLAMSLVSWYFILSKVLASMRVRRAAPAVHAFWAAPTLHDGLATLSAQDRDDIFAALPRAGAQMASKPDTLAGTVGRGEQVVRVLRNEITHSTKRLESGLTLLASIGATAPFIGLLGTVWGIYHALANVSAAGIVQIDKVAGPVGEALIMTGLGLAVAIPAVLAYNGLNRINRVTLAELDGFAHDLHAYFTK